MILYWNDEFWYFDKSNKKKCKNDFVPVRKLYIPSVPDAVSFTFYIAYLPCCISKVIIFG